MKLLGRWSLASVMKAVVGVPYYLLLVFLPVLLALGLWVGLKPGRKATVDLEVPVRVELDAAAHPFSTTRDDTTQVSIEKLHGELSVRRKASGGAVLVGLGAAIIGLGTVLIVLNRLRAILRTLTDQDPFVPANASRIRTIGLVLIIGQLASAGLGAGLAAHVARDVSLAGLTFRPELGLNGWVIFGGLVLLMLAEVFKLGAEMKGDLETARKIQASLVPGEVFRKNRAEVHARMVPARTVGGDYYDVLEMGEEGLAVIVGDVTGKGLPAAMLMASVLGSARALFSAGLRGKDLIAALNRHVCTNAAGGRFVTLFYGELDAATGELNYVNAGHNPPLLARADGSVDRLEPTGMVLGVMPEASFEACRAEIRAADRLLIFTDGYSEAFNKKDEEYGEGRLAESLVRAQGLPLQAAVERVTADVLAFCGSIPPHDDMTLMLVARQAS
jgi:serine phosphatase RsbU (regulator of sigma subunit)